MAPSVVLHNMAMETLSPASVRPNTRNCRACEGSSVTVSGTMTTCTTELLGRVGPVVPRLSCSWHAARTAAAAGTSDAFMSARRFDSLNVNGIDPTPGYNNKPPASTHGRFAGGPADMATRVALVPWLCVAVFRRLCSEQRLPVLYAG